MQEKSKKKIFLKQEQILADLRQMGIQEGDVLFVRANLGSVGRLQKDKTLPNPINPVLQALLEAVGPSGTLITLAFTRPFILFPDKNFVFTRGSKSSSGSLANLMVEHASSFRSLHPTNSVVAIGKQAEKLVMDHNSDSPAYEPIRKLVELNAKMMLIGIAESSPGFTTAHLAEYDLKLYRKVIFPKILCMNYQDEQGNIKLFRRRDPGLCSNSYSKFYSHYVTKELLSTGNIGQAYSIMLHAKPAYELEKSILRKNSKFNLCTDPNCLTCNGRRWDRVHRLPGLLLRLGFKILFSPKK